MTLHFVDNNDMHIDIDVNVTFSDAHNQIMTYIISDN